MMNGEVVVMSYVKYASQMGRDIVGVLSGAVFVQSVNRVLCVKVAANAVEILVSVLGPDIC